MHRSPVLLLNLTSTLFSSKRSIEDTFEKLSPREHVLARPDMYIGGMDMVTEKQWTVVDENITPNTTKSFVLQDCSYIPGLFKIFDEILVNSADNKVRDATQSYIKVSINTRDGSVVIENDGHGIPVAMHQKYDMWVPELIFGQLLTSSNYSADENRITGGRYGYGAKLTNIFSTDFQVETSHQGSGKSFSMLWSDNMATAHKPCIRDIQTSSSRDFTRISFKPDFSKFSMSSFHDNNIVDIMRRRVYDMCGVFDGSMSVYLNGDKLPFSSFDDYVNMFPSAGIEYPSSAFGSEHRRWNIGLRVSESGSFQHVSFVNSIATTRGGTHVLYVADLVVDRVLHKIQKNGTSVSGITPEMVKSHLWVFVNAKVPNPTFDSQTKQTLRTKFEALRAPEYDELVGWIDAFVAQTDIVDRTLHSMRQKYTKSLNQNISGHGGRLLGVPKLVDALKVASQPEKCTLIVTEGDSAKALAISGLSEIGREYYGVYPLRGKFLNVRNATFKQIAECEEVQNLMKILGLKLEGDATNSTYKESDQSTLRYGHLMIMADQDIDGVHIKALLMNLFHVLFPSLLKKNKTFLSQFITPLVKVWDTDNKVHEFYSQRAFERFRLHPGNAKRIVKCKYYKGLGTSTAEEARQYFAKMKQNTIYFDYTGKPCDKSLEMAFDKNFTNERKEWILDACARRDEFENLNKQNHKKTYQAEEMPTSITCHDFVHKELVHFSIADCERSLPSIVDGLKPSQRKILYALFKRNSNSSIKVAQLSGYIAEHTQYHHGEVGLQEAIVNLAQDFVGSNNISYLEPEGQFGTRLAGGKDSASARYIFTKLNPMTRKLFPKEDDLVLSYREEDNEQIEPFHFVPIIPTVLLNGTSGIGTGFQNCLACHNPLDLIQYVRGLLKNKGKRVEGVELKPWYRGFLGTVKRVKNMVMTVGCYRVVSSNCVNVYELPIGMWTTQFKEYLEGLIKRKVIDNFKEHSTDKKVDFDIYMSPAALQYAVQGEIMLEVLGLTRVMWTKPVGLDVNGQIKEYESAEAMVDDYYTVRLNLYKQRKAALLATYAREERILRNKVRFLEDVRTKKVNIQAPIDKLEKQLKQMKYDASGDDGDSADTTSTLESSSSKYSYLYNQRISSFSLEKLSQLKTSLASIHERIQQTTRKTPEEMWGDDLASLEETLRSTTHNKSMCVSPTPDPYKRNHNHDMLAKSLYFTTEARLFMRKMSTATVVEKRHERLALAQAMTSTSASVARQSNVSAALSHLSNKKMHSSPSSIRMEESKASSPPKSSSVAIRK